MAASFKIGQAVKVIVSAPQGTISALTVNQSGDIQYLLSWVDNEGQTQERWFDENTLVEV
jgi:uncharacterized protein YodC (DUF2158 family)